MYQCHSPKSCPLPSPIESKRLLYTSVSFLLSRIQGAGGGGGSGLGTRVHPWRIYVDVWQNQYNIVK